MIFVMVYEEYVVKVCEYSLIGYIFKFIDLDVFKEVVVCINLW